MVASKYGIMLIGAALVSSIGNVNARISRPAKFDFNGNGRSDLAVFENGTWFATEYNGANYFTKVLGDKDSQLVPGVFREGVVSDLCIFKSGVWDVQARNESLWTRRAKFGFIGSTAVPGDYDGDGVIDLAVYAKGVWYIMQSTAGYRQVSFGFSGGYPMTGDFNGDGKDDLVIVWDDLTAKQMKWAIYYSSSNISTFAYGPIGANPVPGRYFGTAATQAAVYWYDSIAKKGYWYIKGKTDPLVIDNGVGSPVGGCDFDGDRKDDVAVYSDGRWLLGMSKAGGKQMTFGYKGAKAVGALTMRQPSAEHQPIIEPKGPGVVDGEGGFLWKPVAENGGLLVVIWPTSVDPWSTISKIVVSRDPAGTQVIDQLVDRAYYEGTARRRYYSHKFSGAGFGNNVYVVAFFKNGRLPKPYHIPTGANRWD